MPYKDPIKKKLNDKAYRLKNRKRLNELQYTYNKTRPGWRRNIERNCQYKREFGITLEQYNQMFINQEGKCAICNKHQDKFNKRLAVDHNHQTGKVRGLLCDRCNRGLGYFKDDANVCTNASNYLKMTEV